MKAYYLEFTAYRMLRMLKHIADATVSSIPIASDPVSPSLFPEGLPRRRTKSPNMMSSSCAAA